MKGNRVIVTAVVVVLVLIVGWYMLRRSGSAGAINLLTQFDQAQKRPDPSKFTAEDVALGRETRRATAPPGGPGTRIVWKVRVPDDGWLRVNLGLKTEAWQKAGGGARFMVLASRLR